MKILVTGCLGHIGSKLIRAFPNFVSDVELVGIDSLLSQRYCSLFNFNKEYDFEFIEGDVRDLTSDNLEGIDIVIHLAAITDAANSFSNASELERNNYNSTKIIADICSKRSIKLISVSSTSVYGTQKDEVDENCSDEDLLPQSPYAETKLKEEELVHNLSINEGLDVTCLRLGTIFGISPGMRFHTAVNKFCWQAVFKKPLTIWTSAYNQYRPYLDIDDAIRAIAHIINNDLIDGFSLYNVLTGNFTVKEVVDTIKKTIPDAEIDFVEAEIMNQLSYKVSAKKFISTGFQFKGDLEKSIQQTIDLIK